MRRRPLTVAVTGLNATDNPGPGVAVIRSLRQAPEHVGRVVGLVYDALEPGIYAEGLVDDVFVIPYPSQGADALRARLGFIQEHVGVDVVIPTLDAELPSFLALQPSLRELGLHAFLPTRDQLDLRSKANLDRMGRMHDLPVPKSTVLNDVAPLYEVDNGLRFPLVLKGAYYGAHVVRSIDEAVRAFHAIVAAWGLPVIVQDFVRGEELDVLAVGDGEGGLVGAIAMKKTTLTDKGKGWAGVVVKDPALLDLAARFVRATHWRGPCEIEVIRDDNGSYQLIEINPRFPAWTYLSAGAGHNLPLAVALLAAGRPAPPLPEPRVGTMFVRIALDQIADLSDFEQLATRGELSRWQTRHRNDL